MAQNYQQFNQEKTLARGFTTLVRDKVSFFFHPTKHPLKGASPLKIFTKDYN
ncbi:MAG: hypothetical protein ACTSVU_07495 [Promethearchaeota archaeon]